MLVVKNNDKTDEQEIFTFWTISKMQRVELLNHKRIHKHWKLVEALRKKDGEDSYVFTSDRNLNRMLRRETITMDVNRVMHSVSKLLPSQPNITSHSFRIGYISQLWKDTKDIEFVRQTIGHRRLDATSSYVNQMTDQERETRISSIKL